MALTKVGFKNNLSMLLYQTSVLYSKDNLGHKQGLSMNYATHGRERLKVRKVFAFKLFKDRVILNFHNGKYLDGVSMLPSCTPFPLGHSSLWVGKIHGCRIDQSTDG